MLRSWMCFAKGRRFASAFLALLLPVLLFAWAASLAGCGGDSTSDASVWPTALCEDGTYSYLSSCTAACASNGGVVTYYNSCTSSNSGSGSSGTNGTANASYAGSYTGTWTLERLDSNAPTTQSLTLSLQVTTDGAISGTATEVTSGRSSIVTGTLGDLTASGVTQLVIGPWTFTSTTDTRSITALWATSGSHAFNVECTYYIDSVPHAYGKLVLTKG